VDGWWAQAVTGGYERIVGLRLPHQMPDGTFSASKSRTIRADAALIDGMLRQPGEHADLFPGVSTQLRSRPDAKGIRIAMGNGMALFSVEAKADGRARVTIQHEKLPTLDDVERWTFYWTEWLDALDEAD
jgi:hypothetical protein